LLTINFFLLEKISQLGNKKRKEKRMLSVARKNLQNLGKKIYWEKIPLISTDLKKNLRQFVAGSLKFGSQI
jgi:hypothetical protein